MSTVAIGLVLVLAGALLFVGQWFDVGIDDIGWPIIVIAIGVILLVLGLVVAGEQGMVIGGTVVTTVGLVLLYQNTTGHWASWAYAWALVGPAASGLGLMLWGARTADGGDIRNGMWGLLGGLGLFLVGFLFFEGVIGIGGDRLALPEWLLPVVVIGIGVVVLGRGLMERREAS
jgi:drug/metabolite transporter (DMT)-like permease